MPFTGDDPRRAELLGELYAVPRFERPFWVFEQVEVALAEGLLQRAQFAAEGRITHRWRLGSGQDRHQQHPDTFDVPADEHLEQVMAGDTVKLMFEFRRPRNEMGSGERMWVEVVAVHGDQYVGELSSLPYLIPRLYPGKTVKFRKEHIIDIIWADEVADEDARLDQLQPPDLAS